MLGLGSWDWKDADALGGLDQGTSAASLLRDLDSLVAFVHSGPVARMRTRRALGENSDR